eukprot:6199090-Prymnesium_polylepis.1
MFDPLVVSVGSMLMSQQLDVPPWAGVIGDIKNLQFGRKTTTQYIHCQSAESYGGHVSVQ